MVTLGEIGRAVGVRLGRQGFAKHRNLIFTANLGADCLGWVGLNVALGEPGSVVVNPVVGVRHQAVERSFRRLRSMEWHPYEGPTIAEQLLFLLPGRQIADHHPAAWWCFTEANIDEEAESLAAHVEAYGLPFMHAHTGLDALLEFSGQGLSTGREYRVPILLRLLGRESEASDTLLRSLQAAKGRDDPGAEQLRSFSRLFLADIPDR